MCGIAGIAFCDMDPSVANASVRQMIAIQNHRGPDGVGFYNSEGISLGHARLAIIDVTETGHQPMSDSSGRYWITYNGEIYNYIELANQLEKIGYSFLGRSDTEVLLNAYRHWGGNFVNLLRGMFAFAIWDEKEKTLFAARDRLGIKPFHYWLDPNKNFFFSSELKAILDFIPNRTVNKQLAQEFLAWNLLDHDESQTMIQQIKRLSPGCFLTWKPNQDIEIERYWSFKKPSERLFRSDAPELLIKEFCEVFFETVNLHLRSDVPIGTSLSGGLDSSAIVSVVNSSLRKGGYWKDGWQHVFSAVFDDPRLDERPYINEVIAATEVEPHFVFPTGEDLRQDLEKWIWHQEEPVGGTGTYAQFCVARLANQFGIKVLLDGQGADEQLAGYRKFILVYIRELIDQGQYYKAFREGLAFFGSIEVLRTSRIVDGGRYIFSSPARARALWQNDSFPKKPQTLQLGNSLSNRMYFDMVRFSLPVLLRYEDRNSMAFGVEARVPFVDHILVEWLSALPSNLLIQKGWTKFILRNGLAEKLPEKIRNRKSKLGFLTPRDEWLLGPLKPWLIETLKHPKYLNEIVDPTGVQDILKRFDRGDHSSFMMDILFRLAIYELWGSQFLVPAIRLKTDHQT